MITFNFIRLPGATPSVLESRRKVKNLTLGNAQSWMRDTWQILYSMVDTRVVTTFGLISVLLLSSIATVYAVHLGRERFVALEALHGERDALESEWSRLLLEESAWSAHARIEQLAAERYGLQIPDPSQVEVVR
jgi:cell division protein FtsL